jgi:hypothetical protein
MRSLIRMCSLTRMCSLILECVLLSECVILRQVLGFSYQTLNPNLFERVLLLLVLRRGLDGEGFSLVTYTLIPTGAEAGSGRLYRCQGLVT